METMNLEQHRELWRRVGRENGWLVEPLYLQVWRHNDGIICDSVTYRGLAADIILECADCVECGECVNGDDCECWNCGEHPNDCECPE